MLHKTPAKIFYLEGLAGSFVAIVTPFQDDGSLDENSFRQLLQWHVKSRTNGIVVCGTTGESATLSSEERAQLVRIAIEECKGKIPVIAGIASNNTAEAVRQAQAMQKLGPDALLVLSPYYNKPPPEGLFQHFKAVAEVGTPIIVYNVPSRTSVNVPPETIIRLAKEVPGILAVKEASGNPAQIMEILREIHARDMVKNIFHRVPRLEPWASPQFTVLLGDDAITLPFLFLGATGCISVVANEVPREFAEMINAALQGDRDRAVDLHFRLLPLMNANFMETNPIPVKTALSIMGKCKPVFRLPLVPMQEQNVEKLRGVLNMVIAKS